jgi:hypothetical protein
MAENGNPSEQAVLDAVGELARSVRRFARAVPGVRTLESGAGAVERVVLRELKRRMDIAAGPGLPPPRAAAGTAAPPQAPPSAQPGVISPAALLDPATALRNLGDTMNALLRRSMDDTPDVSRKLLYANLLRELVPDEARILSALSDGSVYPMVHVAEPGVGTFQKRLLENASSVGRAAGVALPHRTSLYVSHLRRLGLVESRPEDTTLRDEYEILLTEPYVRAVIMSTGFGPLQARIVRRTLGMSDLGRELWEATQGDREPADTPS